jgi:hypothetical protein
MRISWRRRFRLGVVAGLALVALVLTAPAGAATKPKPGTPAGQQYTPATNRTVTVTAALKRVGTCKRSATRRAVVQRKKCKTKACTAQSRRAETRARKNCDKLAKKR